MEQTTFTIQSTERLTEQVFRMILVGNTAAITGPGQFVNIKIDGLFLRRPISVCQWQDGLLTLVFKTVGKGTEALAAMEPGSRLDLLTGLGNGYDTEKSGQTPLLIGGGVGIPPLYGLCCRLLKQGKRPQVVLGFNRAEEVFYRHEFEALGVPVIVTLAEGTAPVPAESDTDVKEVCREGLSGADSTKFDNQEKERAGVTGFELPACPAEIDEQTLAAMAANSSAVPTSARFIRGFVTDAVKSLTYSYFYTCGPEPMLRALDKIVAGSGQFSFEERMGCGFGACMGCSCKTKYGNKRICKDGPVLEREEIIW